MKEKKKTYFTPLVEQINVCNDVLLASQSDNLFSDEEIFDGGGF